MSCMTSIFVQDIVPKYRKVRFKTGHLATLVATAQNTFTGEDIRPQHRDSNARKPSSQLNFEAHLFTEKFLTESKIA